MSVSLDPVNPEYAGTVMSVSVIWSTQSQPLYRYLAPIRGLPPDISPRSWRGPAASDEGPRQVYPKTQLADTNASSQRKLRRPATTDPPSIVEDMGWCKV